MVVAFWTWVVVSGIISLIALLTMLFLGDDGYEFLVLGARIALLSWLWPLVIPWFLILLALNRDPVSPTNKFVP